MPETPQAPAEAPAPEIVSTSAEPTPPPEPAPMLDVHPAHHAATTWRDFFIHIATIVLGLLIAVGLEQTVELIHRHREARQARHDIQNEMAANIKILKHNQQMLADTQQELGKDLDLLNSSTTDAQVLSQLNYSYSLVRRHDAAWNAASINGSLALIPSSEIRQISYYYKNEDSLEPTVFNYLTAMESAGALLNHARVAGKLTTPDRQQFQSLTASALGSNARLSPECSTTGNAPSSHPASNSSS